MRPEALSQWETSKNPALSGIYGAGITLSFPAIGGVPAAGALLVLPCLPAVVPQSGTKVGAASKGF